MCNPAAVVAVLSVAASAYQQQQQVNAQNEYQEYVFEQNNKAALEQYASLRQRELQEAEKTAEGIRRITSEARRARAAATLQAAETNTLGGSVDALLRDFERNELVAKGVVLSNLNFVRQQIRAEERGIAAGLHRPFMQDGPLGSTAAAISTGLGIVAAGAGAYRSSSNAGTSGATGAR